jgi:hypothetical protein
VGREVAERGTWRYLKAHEVLMLRRRTSHLPNRRVPRARARALALHRPAPALGLEREWWIALVAVGLLAVALVST